MYIIYPHTYISSIRIEIYHKMTKIKTTYLPSLKLKCVVKHLNVILRRYLLNDIIMTGFIPFWRKSMMVN